MVFWHLREETALKKGIKAFLTFIIFAIGMAFCIAVSFDSKVEKWLLQYAVIAGAVLLGIFFIGLLILFLAVKAGSEKVHQIGTFLSLPFLYFGMTCLFVLAERICIHRMFATEVAETAAQTSAVSSSLMLAGFVMSVIVAAIILIIILWRTLVEDGGLIFTAVLCIGIVIGVGCFCTVSMMNRSLEEGVVQEDEQPTLPRMLSSDGYQNSAQ